MTWCSSLATSSFREHLSLSLQPPVTTSWPTSCLMPKSFPHRWLTCSLSLRLICFFSAPASLYVCLLVLLPHIILPSPCHVSLSAEEIQLENELGRDKNSTCIRDDKVLFISLVPKLFFSACYWSCSHHTVLICCLLLSSHYSSFQFTLLSVFHALSPLLLFSVPSHFFHFYLFSADIHPTNSIPKKHTTKQTNK